MTVYKVVMEALVKDVIIEETYEVEAHSVDEAEKAVLEGYGDIVEEAFPLSWGTTEYERVTSVETKLTD